MRIVFLKGGPADGQKIEIEDDNATSLQFGPIAPDKETPSDQRSGNQVSMFKINNCLYCQSENDKAVFNYAH